MARVAIDDVIEVARRKASGELTAAEADAELHRLAVQGQPDGDIDWMEDT